MGGAAKGSYRSTDWASFYDAIQTHSYEISDASIVKLSNSDLLLSLDIGDYKTNDYKKIQIRYSELSISLGQEATIDFAEFSRLGEEYWDAFSKRSSTT